MRQQHDLIGAREFDSRGLTRRLVLEHIETGAGDLAGFDQLDQSAFSSITSPRAVLTT